MKKTCFQTRGRLIRWASVIVILMIVAAMVLLQGGASNARALVASRVTADVKAARNHYACNAAVSSTSENTEGFVFATDAMMRSPANSDWPESEGFYYLRSSDSRNKMKRHNDFPPLTDKIIYGLDHGLFDDEVGQAQLRIWEAGVCDDRIEQMIKHRVSKHQLAQAMSGTPFRSPKLTDGDLVFGLDTHSGRLLTWTQYLNAHSLMAAGSGAGKTTYLYFKILQSATRVKGMWLWDLRKREFRILRPYLARLGIDLIVVGGRSWRINPLQLPLGVEPTDWIPRVADMLIDVLELPPRASKLLQSKLFGLYQKFGIFEGKMEYPTLFDLFEEVKKDEQANRQARLAILDNLKPTLLSLGPEVLAYRYGWPSCELARRHLVFEFGGHAETDKNLILNSLVLAEFTSRIARGISNPTMDLWICCDEAQRMCSASGSSGHSAIGSQIGLVRGTGAGLDLSLQSAGDVIPQVPSNTATKVLGRCGSASDYSAMGHSMGLTTEQMRWAQLNLRPGLFIGQLGEGNWRHPFVFRVPPMDLRAVTQQQSNNSVQPLGELPTTPV